MSRQELINVAIEQILIDVTSRDLSAIEELLSSCTDSALKGYINEDSE